MHRTRSTGTRPSFTTLALAVLLLGATTHAAADTDAAGFERITAAQVPWKDVPNGNGVQMAVLSGDPGKPGIYVVQIKFPPGIMSSPHFHDEDRYAVVLKGTWYTGTDAAWDTATAVPLKPGSFMKHPAKAVHYDGAKDEEVTIQVIGMGPSRTTPVYPDEAPLGVPHRMR